MKSKLNFTNFAVTKFAFEKAIIESETKVFEINPQAAISRINKQIHINIDVVIIDPENTFKLNMLSVGIFDYEMEEDDQMLLNFIALNGPAIVFPYVRSFISSYTALSGFDTITLPTLNLSSYKQQILENLIEVDLAGNE